MVEFLEKIDFYTKKRRIIMTKTACIYIRVSTSDQPYA